MTREEAIKQLKKCRSFHNGSYGEAFAMAIKALEQDPCEDWCDVPSDEMTLEQARQAVKDLRKKLAEYLMKETCEDCVSRQAAIDAVSIDNLHPGIVEALQSILAELPSVTPQPKMGRWIETGYTIINSGGQIIHEVICSECSGIAYFRKSFEGKYVGAKICSNCGAKMQEVKE